jgi:3-phenylpropionate/trans-cinnamate dioxygenase ferredoxin subunit
MFNYNKLDPEQCDFADIGPIEDLSEGERLYLEIDNEFIVVFNIAGELYAIADLCSHDDGPLGDGEIEGNEIICPRHGAHFDVRTGKALTLPAVVDIPAYPIRLNDGRIEVGVPKQNE